MYSSRFRAFNVFGVIGLLEREGRPTFFFGVEAFLAVFVLRAIGDLVVFFLRFVFARDSCIFCRLYSLWTRVDTPKVSVDFAKVYDRHPTDTRPTLDL